jgi:dipeptidase D
MTRTFETPEPVTVWERFFELNQVPRPSKAERAAIEFIKLWATEAGFESRGDTTGNLVVHVPATLASSSAPIVILQCHVDIVAVTAEGAPNGVNALHGRIPTVRGDLNPADEKRLLPNVAGDWINAPFTTLGADNGIGVAMMMALAESKHRPVPMQLLFTIDEEAGMTGAFGLDPIALGLTGKTLINIDTEDDDEITIGAAGGRDVEIRWLCPLESTASGSCFSFTIKGLKGGHSGIEINQGRANAIRVLSRTLQKLADALDLRLMTLNGGSRRNAIPDFCTATVEFDGAKLSTAQAIIQTCCEQWNQLYAGRDNPIAIELKPSSDPIPATFLSSEGSRSLLQLLTGIPVGICEMTSDIPTLVESSCNLAIVALDATGTANIICSVRGTTGYAAEDICDTIRSIVGLAGGTVEIADGYPGWKPRLDSPLLKIAIDQYKELFGTSPRVHAVHAGLECGLLIEKLPGLDTISIGPTIKGNHAVGERVQISSVQKSYKYLTAILEQLKQ